MRVKKERVFVDVYHKTTFQFLNDAGKTEVQEDKSEWALLI